MKGKRMRLMVLTGVAAALLASLAAALTIAQADDPSAPANVILLGAVPHDDPPEGAVAWMAVNDEELPRNEIVHSDGPFALPGAPNPDGLPVLDRLDTGDANWRHSEFDACGPWHLHGTFNGHGDPDGGVAATASWCTWVGQLSSAGGR